MSSEAKWWGATLLLCALHVSILIFNFVHMPPTHGYDWPGHLAYLQYVADHWQAPPAGQMAQSFNPPLYYFSVAAFHSVAELELGRAGQVFNLLLALTAIALLVGASRRLWRGQFWPNAWFIGLYVLNPTVYRAFGMVRPEAMLIPFFASALYLGAWSATEPRRWKTLAVGSGLLAGVAFGVRQWGIFLEGAFLLWILLCPIRTFSEAHERPTERRNVLASLLLQVSSFAIPATLLFSIRGGSPLAFNTAPQKIDLVFLTRLELPRLFSRPLRPTLNYRFWPVLYADLWGDYWRYWREALGRDAMPTSVSTIRSLVRSMWAALPASWLMLSGLFVRAKRLVGQQQARARARLHRLARILVIVSLAGFLLFASLYAQPGKGDTVKSIYLVYLIPFWAWLASAAVYDLLGSFPRQGWLFLLSLALLVAFVMPNALYLAPAELARRTTETPPVQHSSNVVFDEAIELVGYNLEVNPATGELKVTLVWKAIAYAGARYKVFVHLMSAGGERITQSDAVPAQGRRPTTGWVPGEYIVDLHTLELGAGDLADADHLILGLYRARDGQRLETTTGQDYVRISLDDLP